MDAIKLIKEYNDILKLSNFPDIKNFLIDINKQFNWLQQSQNLTQKEKQLLSSISKKIPDPKYGITTDHIPIGCYYSVATKSRNDGFTIDKRHTKMNGKSKVFRNKQTLPLKYINMMAFLITIEPENKKKYEGFINQIKLTNNM